MPYVNIRIAGHVTPEQKADMIRGVTDLVGNVLKRDPRLTHVVIDELETDNWGLAGETLTARWARETSTVDASS